MSNLYFENKDYQKALNAISAAIKIDSRNAEYIANRAKYNYFLDNNDLAAADAKQALSLNPKLQKAKDVLLALAGDYIKLAMDSQKSFDESLAICNKAIEIYPENYRAFACRSEVYQNLYLKDKDKDYLNLAIKDSSKAIELSPNNVFLYAIRSLLYYETGNVAANIADLTKAIELYPKLNDKEKEAVDVSELYVYRATAQLQNKNTDTAIDDLTKAISLATKETTRADAFYSRAEAYKLKGNKDLALADFWKALETNNKIQGALEEIKNLEFEKLKATGEDYLAFAQKHLQNKDKLPAQHRELALAALEKAIEQKPSVQLYMLRAKAYSEAESNSRAAADLTAAIVLEPQNAELYKLRAAAYRELDEQQKALKDLETAARLNPNDAEIKKDKIYAILQDAIDKRDLNLAMTADKEFEAAFKGDKSVETALRRLNLRFAYWHRSNNRLFSTKIEPYYLDAKVCQSAEWALEGYMKFQKEFKNFQNDTTRSFQDSLKERGQTCVEGGLNPVGEYYMKGQESKQYNAGTFERTSCWLTIKKDLTYERLCIWDEGKILQRQETGIWRVENGNQVRFFQKYSKQFDTYEQRYIIWTKKSDLIDYTETLSSDALGDWKPLCNGSSDSILCK